MVESWQQGRTGLVSNLRRLLSFEAGCRAMQPFGRSSLATLAGRSGGSSTPVSTLRWTRPTRHTAHADDETMTAAR